MHCFVKYFIISLNLFSFTVMLKYKSFKNKVINQQVKVIKINNNNNKNNNNNNNNNNINNNNNNV